MQYLSARVTIAVELCIKGCRKIFCSGKDIGKKKEKKIVSDMQRNTIFLSFLSNFAKVEHVYLICSNQAYPKVLGFCEYPGNYDC